ncbi:HNH endonuclease, partial [Clostridium estertheticum]|uniref:HNH endonuclease n=1 Tax=Clostridium estertheticum TaxID=238834 RepID=UPI001CF17594
NSPDDSSLKEYFEKRDKREFIKDNVLSRRKLAKYSNYKCRVCKQSLVGEESLKINQIVPLKLGGDKRYANLELLHKSCQRYHQTLLEKYGGGRDLSKIVTYFKNNQVEPNSKEGYELIKKAFMNFKYQLV